MLCTYCVGWCRGSTTATATSRCEGGMPASFELREEIGADRLQAVEDWLHVEGYAYRFRQKRLRVWTRPDRPGDELRLNGIEDDENPNEYP